MREDQIHLNDGIAEVVIVPALGAGLARYDLLSKDGRTSLLRPAPNESTDPFALACNLLLPWSNRVSAGGFTFDGRFHGLQPNWPGEPCPIHGNAFSLPWEVAETGRRSARLVLDSPGPGPFRYSAEVSYALEGGALTIGLQAANKADIPLPYGLGLHPWLPRTPGTTLLARAGSAWLEDERHLPAEQVSIERTPEWDFRRERSLPAEWINNAFCGWDGVALIRWPERRLGLSIQASPELSTFMVYSPGSHADFFCFEPVMHPVDSFNLPGGPAANGMATLEPGELVRVTCKFEAVASPGFSER